MHANIKNFHILVSGSMPRLHFLQIKVISRENGKADLELQVQRPGSHTQGHYIFWQCKQFFRPTVKNIKNVNMFSDFTHCRLFALKLIILNSISFSFLWKENTLLMNWELEQSEWTLSKFWSLSSSHPAMPSIYSAFRDLSLTSDLLEATFLLSA